MRVSVRLPPGLMLRDGKSKDQILSSFFIEMPLQGYLITCNQEKQLPGNFQMQIKLLYLLSGQK